MASHTSAYKYPLSSRELSFEIPERTGDISEIDVETSDFKMGTVGTVLDLNQSVVVTVEIGWLVRCWERLMTRIALRAGLFDRAGQGNKRWSVLTFIFLSTARNHQAWSRFSEAIIIFRIIKIFGDYQERPSFISPTTKGKTKIQIIKVILCIYKLSRSNATPESVPVPPGQSISQILHPTPFRPVIHPLPLYS